MTNLFTRFRRLLPSEPLRSGTVTAYSDGVATITEANGGVSKARGDAAVGDRVFFRAGAIEGPAPDLTPVSITV